MIYDFHVYRRDGRCLYRATYKKGGGKGDLEEEEERSKLIFGMSFSLKDMVSQLTPNSRSCHVTTVKTPKATLHTYETPTGFRFVTFTDPSIQSMQQHLKHIYGLWVEHVVKCPLTVHSETRDGRDGGIVDIAKTDFQPLLTKYVENIPGFR